MVAMRVSCQSAILQTFRTRDCAAYFRVMAICAAHVFLFQGFKFEGVKEQGYPPKSPSGGEF
jgi:hypothetical protein